MKEISINADQIRSGQSFDDFVKRESPNCDIFCFQEIPRSKVEFLKYSLPDFEAIVAHKRVDSRSKGEYGQATFFRRPLSLKESGKLLEANLLGFAIWTKFNINGSDLTIVNLHGVPKPGDKRDNHVRIKQSEIVLRFLDSMKGPKIIGGDLNLLPDTTSIKMFEDAGYKNLIKDFDIKTTRNSLAWRKFQDHPGYVKQYFADYFFVSPEVKINSFEVPDIEVSDHLPLFLDFET